MEARDIRSNEDLLQFLDEGGRPKYVYFWGHRPGSKDQVDKACLSADDAQNASAAYWKGLNLPGYALMQVRDQLSE